MKKIKVLWFKDKSRGYRAGMYVKNPYLTFIKGLINFPVDFIKGKYYGYPTCCVLYYCLMQMTGVPAGICTSDLFEIESQKKEYAQCINCLIPKKNKKI